MKLSRKTIEILKTFSGINSNLLLQEGSVIKTISVAQNIVGIAEVEEAFPMEFGIYNTAEFLGALSLFKEPELHFSEKFVKITDAAGNFSLKYVAASKDVLVVPERDVKEPAFELEFNLTQDQLASILKGASIIGAPDVQINGTNEGLFVRVCDRKNPSANDYELKIDNEPGDFTYNLKVDNLKLLAGDYRVKIAKKGLSLFDNSAAKVKTFIALVN